jgi:AMMECR1 domain-containing protein
MHCARAALDAERNVQQAQQARDELRRVVGFSNPVASNRQAVSQAAQAVVLDSRFDAPPSKRQEVHSV